MKRDTVDMGFAFSRTAERVPDRLGLVDVDAGVKYTYAEWEERIESVASALDTLGIKPGTRVGAILENRAELATLYWATQYVGATFVPLNHRVAADEFRYLVETIAPTALFFSASSRDVVESTNDAVEIDTYIYVDEDPPGFAISHDAFLNIATGAFQVERSDSHEESIILHTSGTTGKPKGVRRSHLNTYMASLAQADALNWDSGERVLGLMSLYHTMGFHTLTTSVLHDSTWISQSSFDPRRTLETITDERISCLHMVPSVWHEVFTTGIVDEFSLECVDHVSYGGMALREPIREEILEAIDPETFVNHYGSTEVYTHTACDRPKHENRCVGTAGPNTSVRVVQLRNQGEYHPSAEVETGDIGEVVVDATSPEAMLGYLDGAGEQTVHDEWFFTGDLGYVDEQGSLHLVGRLDDMILSGGENIYPVEVESTLNRHQKVRQAAVVGLEHEKWNQVITAFVESTTSPNQTDFEQLVEEIDAYCKESDSLADFKRPQKYILVESISTKNVGKLVRRELRKPTADIEILAEITI